MAIGRRIFLAAGSGAVAVLGGAGLRAWQTGLLGGSRDPYELWTVWHRQPWPLSIVAAGVLAANPHNTQPWLFRVQDPKIDLHLDRRQALGPVDPFARQMWIGAGCAVENMVFAARAAGRVLAVTPLPDPAQSVAARLIARDTCESSSELVEVISRRHTNRGAYFRDRRLGEALTADLSMQVSDSDTRVDIFDHDSERGRDFANGIREAALALVADEPLIHASDSWFRLTPREEAEHRDGPSLRCAGLPAYKRALGVLGPRPSDRTSHDAWLSMTTERHLGTAPSFGCLSVGDPESPRQLLAAGRLWQRLMLWGTSKGLAMQPLDQLLELADRERELGLTRSAAPRLARLTDGSHTPVMMFRVGFPESAAPASARRTLTSFLTTAD